MKVLVVGCERSGTSVIAGFLSKAGNLSLLDDPEDSWYIYPLVRKIGVSGFTMSLILRMWKHDIVKVPGFAVILERLRKVHPKKFKVIYVVRDPRDTYAAIKERLKVNYNGLYLNIEFLNKTGNSQVENIAIRWQAYLNNAIAYKNKYPDDILFIKYEDFNKNKIEVIKKIADFSGIRINTDLIQDDLEVQINKFWSKEIKGHKRYLNELKSEEINEIEKITQKGIKAFKYNEGIS